MRILPINYEEHINENDLEIIKEYATILDNGSINSVLKSILRDFFYDQKKTSEDIEQLLEVLFRKVNQTVILTDLDRIIYSLGEKKYEGLELSNKFKSILHNRKVYDGYILEFANASSFNSDIYCLPLISYGELYGSIIILQNKDYLLETDKEIIKLIGEYIIKKLDF